MSRHLATVGKKNSFLMGRNPELCLGWAAICPDQSGWGMMKHGWGRWGSLSRTRKDFCTFESEKLELMLHSWKKNFFLTTVRLTSSSGLWSISRIWNHEQIDIMPLGLKLERSFIKLLNYTSLVVRVVTSSESNIYTTQTTSQRAAPVSEVCSLY